MERAAGARADRSHRGRSAREARAQGAARAGAGRARLRRDRARPARQPQLPQLTPTSCDPTWCGTWWPLRSSRSSRCTGAFRSPAASITAVISRSARRAPSPHGWRHAATTFQSTACRPIRRSGISPIRCSVRCSTTTTSTWSARSSTSSRISCIYVAGDSEFDESFAMSVQDEGVRRWLRRGAAARAELDHYLQQQRSSCRSCSGAEGRRALKQLYAEPLPLDQRRARKHELMASLVQQVRAIEVQHGLHTAYDDWIGEGLNNARLASVGTYFDCVAGFESLLAVTRAICRVLRRRARPRQAAARCAPRAAVHERLRAARVMGRGCRGNHESRRAPRLGPYFSNTGIAGFGARERILPAPCSEPKAAANDVCPFERLSRGSREDAAELPQARIPRPASDGLAIERFAPRKGLGQLNLNGRACFMVSSAAYRDERGG